MGAYDSAEEAECLKWKTAATALIDSRGGKFVCECDRWGRSDPDRFNHLTGTADETLTSCDRRDHPLCSSSKISWGFLENLNRCDKCGVDCCIGCVPELGECLRCGCMICGECTFVEYSQWHDDLTATPVVISYDHVICSDCDCVGIVCQPCGDTIEELFSTCSSCDNQFCYRCVALQTDQGAWEAGAYDRADLECSGCHQSVRWKTCAT